MSFLVHWLPLILLAPVGQALAQRHIAGLDDTLAVYGSSVITAGDFLERIELMPWPGKDRRGEHDSAKVRALRALIAEKLLAQEAAVRGLGRDSSALRLVDALERLMVRDELFRREVVGRIVLSDQDIAAGMRRYPKKLHLLVLRSPSGEAAQELRDSLRGFTLQDTLRLKRSPRLLARVDTLLLTYGSIDEILEDTAFALSPRRRVSGVVRSDHYGWGVVVLLGEGTNPDAVKKSVSERLQAVQTILRARKQHERSAQYSGRILAPQRAEADSAAFERVASTLERIFAADPDARRKRGGYRLGTADLDTLELLLGPDVYLEFVSIASGSMTVRDVLDALRNRDFTFVSLEPEPFRDRLNAMVKDVVRAELLTREGYRQNIQNTSKVRHDVGVWRDYWTAGAYLEQLRNGVDVTEEEVMAYLIEHALVLGRPYEVNVREVFTDSLPGALRALERILGGEAFGTVAAELSQRRAWAARGGESGYFSVASMPTLGFAALLADTGSVQGPLALDGGYSIFQVLGKRIAVQDSVPAPDSVRVVAGRAVRAERQRRVIEEEVSRLASKAGVRIDNRRLESLQVNPSNMVTTRYLGFGGVMTAVPNLLPLWNWNGPEPAEIVP